MQLQYLLVVVVASDVVKVDAHAMLCRCNICLIRVHAFTPAVSITIMSEPNSVFEPNRTKVIPNRIRVLKKRTEMEPK